MFALSVISLLFITRVVVAHVLFVIVSSRKLNSVNLKLRVSNPRIVAHLDLYMHFESSNLPRSGSIFPDV